MLLPCEIPKIFARVRILQMYTLKINQTHRPKAKRENFCFGLRRAEKGSTFYVLLTLLPFGIIFAGAQVQPFLILEECLDCSEK